MRCSRYTLNTPLVVIGSDKLLLHLQGCRLRALSKTKINRWFCLFTTDGRKDQLDTNITLNFDYCQTPSTYYTYQKYYLQGLKATWGVTCEISPFSSKILAYLRDANVRGVDWIWKRITELHSNRSEKSNHVGRYSVEIDSNRFNVVIDDADGKGIRDEDALNWSDIYFKANKWPDLEYPMKVYPIVNGNGKLDFNKINAIKNHRHTEKKVELVYMSKLWSRPDCFENIVEHQVRVFEVLAELDCTKHLRAIVFKDPQNKLSKYLKRLDAAGVEWSHSWGDINSAVFWNELAGAKIVFQRSGNHHCISWRMTDLLCMGACIVMDKSPYPQWPVPLEHGKHFVNCDCGFAPDYSIPPKERYRNITRAVEELLKDEEAQYQYRKNSREYFDHYATPQKVAAYVLDTLKSKLIAK